MISIKQATKYCKDDISRIENYQEAINDKEHMWCVHHRLEITLDGHYAHSQADLKRFGMFYKRPYFELIFLTLAEHRHIHSILEPNHGENHPSYGKPSWNKGKKGIMKAWNKGLTGVQHHSDITKHNISVHMKGKAKHNTGRHWKLVNGKRVWFD